MGIGDFFKRKPKQTEEELGESDEEFIKRLRAEMRTVCSMCGKEKFKFEGQHLPIEVVTGMRRLSTQERDGYATFCLNCETAVCGQCLPRLDKAEEKRICPHCREDGFPLRLK